MGADRVRAPRLPRGCRPDRRRAGDHRPYRLLRHLIYAAVLYFVWAGALDHRTVTAIVGAAAATIGAALRVRAEEQLLNERFAAYRAYSGRTARIVPFLL